MSFYDEFSYWIETKGVNKSKLAKSCNITGAAVSYWKSRGSIPKLETQKKIANFLDISVEQLNDHTVSPPLIKKLYYDIEIYDRISNSVFATIFVPVYGKILRTEDMEKNAHIEELIPVNISLEEDPKSFFFLRVLSDNMIGASIPKGSSALIRKQDYVNCNGEIVACRIKKQQVILRRYTRQKDKIILSSENEAYYPDIFTTAQAKKDIEIIGVVKQVVIDNVS